ncbi:MAG: hypothetical protein ISR65_00480 [Bacteriovoracaceae bacterium]|nr:hypothetical protein [Bacteriovoracaceae bacterium]
MNFKVLLIIPLFLLASCGVKSRPIPPADRAIPSYIDKFMKKPPHQSDPNQVQVHSEKK